MTTYNGEKYLREQIDSILSQTIQDFELIVCDDCSTDSTIDILNKYQQSDKRIKVYRNDSNLGFKKNFEKAISLCHGEYIALSDQDDIWMPDHLELLLKAIGTKSMAFGNCNIVDENGKSLGMTVQYQESMDTVPNDDISWGKTVYLFRNPAMGMAMLFKRDLLKYALPFPDIKLHDIWLICLSSMMDGISYVETPIVNYRRLGTSITGMRTTRRWKYTHIKYSIMDPARKVAAETILNRIPDLSLTKKNFLKRVIMMVARNGTHKGRLLNRSYLLSHYYGIFNCTLLRWR